MLAFLVAGQGDFPHHVDGHVVDQIVVVAETRRLILRLCRCFHSKALWEWREKAFGRHGGGRTKGVTSYLALRFAISIFKTRKAADISPKLFRRFSVRCRIALVSSGFPPAVAAGLAAPWGIIETFAFITVPVRSFNPQPTNRRF
nr:hypothetical protein [Methylogaea oryzae]